MGKGQPVGPEATRPENSGTGQRSNKRDWWLHGLDGKGGTSMNSSITGCLSVGRKINFLPAKHPLQPSGLRGAQGHLYDWLYLCLTSSAALNAAFKSAKYTELVASLLPPPLCPLLRSVYWIGLNGGGESWWGPRWLRTRQFAVARTSQRTSSTICCFADKPKHVRIESLSG